MWLPFALLALVLALLALESVVVHRDVARLKRRVHVGGTRGKSSVTRYIAAGLRESGDRTWGKITGVRPTLLPADGSPQLIKRRGGARVQEQFQTVHRAVKDKASSLVLECMSITPELQNLETRVFRPHVFVLTKIRDDHREQLGHGPDQIEAMCSAIPYHSQVVTDDLEHRDIINRTAAQRGSRVTYVEKSDDLLAAACPEGAFPINLTLALCACEALGVEREAALRGIVHEAVSEARPVAAVTVSAGGAKFVNGFAVNDVESAQQFVDYWRAKESASELMIILNTRSDRPLRSLLFAEWLARLGAARVVLLGDHAACASRALAQAGMDRARITVWGRRQLNDILGSLSALNPQDALIVGLGNIGGDGFRVADALGTPV